MRARLLAFLAVLALALPLAAQVGTSVFSTASVTATGAGPWFTIPDGSEANIEFSALTATAPTAPTAALVADGTGNCTAGSHVFAVTYVTAAGETTVSSSSAPVTCDASHTKVTVTIPVSPENGITARNVYTSAAGTATPLLLVSTSPVVNNNTATTYTFNIADGSLTATNPPSTNGTGVSTATENVYTTNDPTIACASGVLQTGTAISNPSAAAHQGVVLSHWKFFCVNVATRTAGVLATNFSTSRK